MKNYCGKNGCYDFFENQLTDELILAIYLNSTPIYEPDINGKFTLALPAKRQTSDIDFIFTNDSETVPFKMRIFHFHEEGLCRFVKELMNAGGELESKDGIIKAVQKLLDKENAPWGVIPSEIELKISH